MPSEWGNYFDLHLTIAKKKSVSLECLLLWIVWIPGHVLVYTPCRYTVYDLTAERQYQVTLHVGLCLEAHSPCIFGTTVFKNTLLPKKVCKLYTGFAHASKSKYMIYLHVYSYCVAIWFQLFNMVPFVSGNGWNKWKLY